MYKIIGTDEKEYGPVPSNQIREWIKEGRLNRQTPLQAAGSTEWKPLWLQPEFTKDFVEQDAPPVVPPPESVGSASSGSGINVIIPYKNPRALIAYYLAVFSLIPFVGIVLGLAAFVLGILGLRFRRQNPTAGGVVHAWIGIILGGLCGFGWLVVTILVIFSAAKHH